MKVSRFNFLISYKSGWLAFNAKTCALAEVDKDFIEALDAIHDKQEGLVAKELLDQMYYGGFIVDDTKDELSDLELVHTQAKFDTTTLGLTIAPTLNCNFACPYCYESRDTKVMSAEVQKQLVAFIANRASELKLLQVTWYGGEPLLHPEIISSLSKSFKEICSAYSIAYHAYIISNAYLVNEETIKLFRDCNMGGIQITIDGPKRIHDTRRVLRGGNRPTFDRIIQSVKMLLEAGFTPDIRINIDKTNADCVDELLRVLQKEGLCDCNINFGHVNAYTEACANIDSTCLTLEEYASDTIDLQKKLFEYGFTANSYPLYPGTKANYCCADSISSLVVDPEGYLFKCWNDIGSTKRRVGSIEATTPETTEQLEVFKKYLLWSPFAHAKCNDCKLLPVCMGGCPYNGLRNNGEPECEKWIHNLNDTLCLMKDFACS